VDLPPFNWVPGIIWFSLKLLFMFFLFAMAKAIVPRYRYDQLMRLGWKVFLPLSLAMVVIVAGVLQFADIAPKGGCHGYQRHSPFASADRIRIGLLSDDALFLPAEADAELSVREGTDLAALPGRACAAPLSEWRGTLHRLQAVRSDLSSAGHYHRGRPAPQRRHAAHGALRHRYGEMHLLRAVPGGLPGGCHRRGTEFRIRDRDPRGTLL